MTSRHPNAYMADNRSAWAPNQPIPIHAKESGQPLSENSGRPSVRSVTGGEQPTPSSSAGTQRAAMSAAAAAAASGTRTSRANAGASANNQMTTALRPTPSSSANTSDDEDDDDAPCADDDTSSVPSYKDRRREAHTFAEQKRRDSIKRGYEELQRLVPTCHQADPTQQQTSAEDYDNNAASAAGGSKLSKAAVLQRSIDYIQHLVQQQKKQAKEIESLRKEVLALKIMKANYEEMVKSHHCSIPSYTNSQLVPDEIKMAAFLHLIDGMFKTFDSTVCTSSFAELSACVFYWLEDSCKPGVLREMMVAALQRATMENRNGRARQWDHRSV